MSFPSPELEIVAKHQKWSKAWTGCNMAMGHYLFDYRRHDTGQNLRIFAVDDLGDSLLVYREDHWFSSTHDFNNRDTVQGFQAEGPWVHQLQTIFGTLAAQNEEREKEVQAKAAAEAAARVEAEAKKLEKFRALCAE